MRSHPTAIADRSRLTGNVMARIGNRHMEQMGRWYLRVRLAVALLLLAACTQGAFLRRFFPFDTPTVLATALALLAANRLFVYAHAAVVKRFWVEPARFHAGFQALVFCQIVVDWVALCVLVVSTGGVGTGFAHFLLVHSAMSASVLGPLHTLLYSTLSAAIYGALAVHSVVALGADPGRVAAGGALFLLLLLSIIGLLHLLYRMRHDAYARYESAREKLERLDLEKTEYMLLVTHEIKAPLAVVINQAKLIRDGYTGKIEAKTREILEKQIARAANLLLSVNDILRFSNLHTCLDVREKFVEFAALPRIRRVLDTLQAEPRVDLAVAPGTDDRLIGVPDQFDTLVTNLVANALKYSRADTRVTVEAGRRDGGFLLRVTDRGTGIAADELPNLFTPFFRTSAAMKFSPGGTGLGLSICRKIVELNQGTIAATSRLGEGTVLTVTWPLFAAAEG